MKIGIGRDESAAGPKQEFFYLVCIVQVLVPKAD